MSNYRSNIVKKPWGHEYLVYENNDVSIWFLHIEQNQNTSMHCHPKKTTGLIALDGIAEVSFLADRKKLESIDKVMIRRGLFHSTKALSENGAFIFEIETPVDKQDLVRLNDDYGRTSKPYENYTFESPKTEDCLWIQDPELNKQNIYNFANCILRVENISNIQFINELRDDELIVFLKGGLVRNIQGKFHNVTIPGDVGFAKIVKQVSKQLDGIADETIIMVINKNE